MPGISDNQGINQTIDAVSQNLKALDMAFAAYYPSHCFDPNDVQTLFGLVGAELQKSPELVDSSLLIEFMVFHREKIKQSLVDHIYKMLARDYADAIACVKASSGSISGANPDEDNPIEKAMNAAVAAGEAEAQRVQEQLMAMMLTAENRAQLLVGIGDVYLIHYGRETEARTCYQAAFAEDPTCQDAVERIFAVSEHLYDWEASFAALETLKKLQPVYMVSYRCKEAWILGRFQGKHDSAIAIYQSILDEHPRYLDIFVRLINEYQAINDMGNIKKSFVSMMERGKSDKTIGDEARLAYELGLGKICLIHLRSIPAAIRVYRSACGLAPNNIHIHTILSKLYEANGETDKQLEEYHEILFIQPNNQDVLLELAQKYRELGRFDESLCCYRILKMIGCQDEDCLSIVAKFGDLGVPDIQKKISDDLWQLVIPWTLDGYLVRLLKICAKIAGDLFANEFSTYKIHPKDARINITEDTTFNRAIRNETNALGFAEVPVLYRCDQFSGVTNAYFTDRSFLIHSNCLKGRSHKELAFISAKALLLMRPEYYLLQLGLPNVELILRSIIKTIRPSTEIELDKNQELVSKKLEKGLTPEQRTALGEIIDEMQKKHPYNTPLFFESAEEFANRVGLLFCDDITIVEHLLEEEAKPISTRTPHERLESLMIWAMSEEYFKLRKRLNIALKA